MKVHLYRCSFILYLAIGGNLFKSEGEKMETFTVGKLAKKAGVHVETLRFYERRGLMPEPVRTASGYRQYSAKDVKRLRFIKHAQELGFSLKEIRELLHLRVDPETTCRDVRQQVRVKIADIEAKLIKLEEIRKALVRLETACSRRGPTSDCPILEFLDQAG